MGKILENQILNAGHAFGAFSWWHWSSFAESWSKVAIPNSGARQLLLFPLWFPVWLLGMLVLSAGMILNLALSVLCFAIAMLPALPIILFTLFMWGLLFAFILAMFGAF